MGRREGWIILIFVALAFVQLTYIALALMELHSSRPAFAQDEEINRQTLNGLRGVHVVIEWLKPEIGEGESAEDWLRADTELRLRRAGIKVLSAKQNQMTPGRPSIYVSVSIVKYRYLPAYVYTCTVELLQDVYLVRAFKIRTGAVTWSVNTTGIAPKLEDIKDAAGELVDYFTEAYSSANRKREGHR